MYPREFHAERDANTRQSAREIIPLILGIIQPKSVIDIGCGVGTWLSVFNEYGIDEIFGVDGEWVDKKMLRIPEEKFIYHDLNKPFRLNRQFDLVVSLEVAEHLPAEAAENFIDSLTNLGAIVLFSAAIPFQGGINHLNEQWQDFWAKLFQIRGYQVIDLLRKKIWSKSNVCWWYAQNILLFARNEMIEANPKLKDAYKSTDLSQLSLVHPRMHLEITKRLSEAYNPENLPLKKVLPGLPAAIKKMLARRIRKT